jgi:hypothetical protein
MATRKPPRVISRVRQPTTRSVPSGGSAWARGYVSGPGYKPPAAVAPVAATAPVSQVAAPQYSLSNLPVDASYDAVIASLGLTRSNTLTALTGERARTLSDYGFNETNIDPATGVGTLAYDPNNPFSKAAVLKKTYDTGRRSTAQSMGASGQMTGGAFQNSQDLLNRNQLQSEDAQTKALQAFLAGNTTQKTAADTGYETAAGQAYGDRVGRFQSNPNYDPATGTIKPDTPAAAAAPAAAPGAAGPASSAALEVWQKGTYKGRKAVYRNGKWYYTTANGELAPIPGTL